MNKNLWFRSNSSGLWMHSAMPRVLVCDRGSSYNFSANADHHLFVLTIAANDPWINERIQILPYVSIHSASWSESSNFLWSCSGPISGVGASNGDSAMPGCRGSAPEYTPSSGSYPNGGGSRRAHVPGFMTGQITGNGSIYIRLKMQNSWEMRDDNLEQTRCLVMLLGG